MSTTLRSQYLVIALAVSCYWACSIGLVFINKYLLSSAELKLDAPLFITFFQCFISIILCLVCAQLSASFPQTISFPRMVFDHKLCREVLPLSFVFVGMITFNNLCLQNVGVSFYYVGRSLTTVFNVVCTYAILGQVTSKRALACCAIIVLAFFLGVDQEDVVGTLSVTGVLYGVLASLCVALNAIYTKKSLPIVGDSIWLLTFYNNINACAMFIVLILLSGELTTLMYFEHLFSLKFWLFMLLSGFFGFIMGYVTGWQIQVTSALTHNISGTAKAAAQTVMAIVVWEEVKTLLWWSSNLIILLASGAYTYFQKQDMDRKFSSQNEYRKLKEQNLTKVKHNNSNSNGGEQL